MTEPVITRGGWVATGTAAGRRATVADRPGPKAARTRQLLLDAARRAFARHGYVDTTIEHVITEAGVSRGTFYTYFESKAHVFGHLASSIDREIAEQVVAFDRSADHDPVANLRTSNRNYLGVVRSNADLYRLVEEAAVSDPAVRDARARSRRQHVRRVARSIRRWQEHGWADRAIDPDDTAAALVAMLSGYAQWLHVAGADEDVDDERAADLLSDIWVRACGLRAP